MSHIFDESTPSFTHEFLNKPLTHGLLIIAGSVFFYLLLFMEIFGSMKAIRLVLPLSLFLIFGLLVRAMFTQFCTTVPCMCCI